MAGGHARWSGLARFRRGVVQSDVLLVERSVTVSTDDETLKGYEREYITLNAVPSYSGVSLGPPGFPTNAAASAR